MKCIKTICCIIIGAAGIAACGMQPFSSLKIKASPKFEFQLGSREMDLTETLAQEIEKNLPDGGPGGKDPAVYPFDARDKGGLSDTMYYMVHVPLVRQPLDVSKQLDSIATSMEKDFPAAEFKIPEVKKTEQVAVNLSSINSKILEKFTAPPQNVSIPVPSGAVNNIPYPYPIDLPTVTLSFSSFETVTLASGSAIQITTTGNNVTYSISYAVLQKDTGGFLASGDINGTDITFNLAGKPLPNKLKLSLTLSNITKTGNDPKISVTPSLSGKIEQATGVTLRDPIEITAPTQTIKVPENEYFISGKIKTGSIMLNPAAPSGWSGITFKKDLAITQADGLTVSGGSYTPMNEAVLLDGNSLNKNDIKVEPKVQVTIQNATYTAADTMNMNFAFSIGEFEEVTLKQPANINKKITEPIPNDMENMVESITFEKITAAVTIRHNLPAGTGGQHLTLKLQSDIFKINDEKSFPATSAPGHTETFEKMRLNLEPAGKENFDFTPTLTLPNSSGDKFTLHNVKPGDTLSFGGKIKLTAEWSEIKLKKVDAKTGDPITLSLEEISEKLKKYNVQFQEIPLYCYVSSEALAGKDVKLKLTADVARDNSTETKVLLGTDADAAQVQPASFSFNGTPFPQLQPKQRVSGSIEKGKETIAGAKPAFVLRKEVPNVQTTIADILNTYPEKITLNYEMSMAGATFTKGEIDKLKKSSEVRIDAALLLPVSAVITGKTEVKLEDFTEMNADLFGRNGPTDISAFKKFLKKVRLDIDLAHNSGIDDVKLIFSADNGNGKEIIEQKELTTSSGRKSISFTNDEIQTIADNPVFIPRVKVVLNSESSKKTYTIKSGSQFKVRINVQVDADIDYQLL